MQVSQNVSDIQNLIDSSKYEQALVRIKKLKENQIINDDIYYEEALVYFNLASYNDSERTCKLGLQYDPLQSRFYSLLGMIYLKMNFKEKAYICFEQAESLSKMKNDNISALRNINSLSSINCAVKKLSVIVFDNGNFEYTKLCIESLSKFSLEKDQIIVVAYGCKDERYSQLETYDNVCVKYINNKNLLSAYNEALLEIGYDRDIMILDSRTILLPNSIFTLRMALYENPDVAIVSSVSNNAYNEQYKDVNCGDFNDFALFASKNNIPNVASHVSVNEVELFCSIIKADFLLGMGLLTEKYIISKDAKTYFRIGNVFDNKKFKSLVCKDSFVYRIL